MQCMSQYLQAWLFLQQSYSMILGTSINPVSNNTPPRTQIISLYWMVKLCYTECKSNHGKWWNLWCLAWRKIFYHLWSAQRCVQVKGLLKKCSCAAPICSPWYTFTTVDLIQYSTASSPPFWQKAEQQCLLCSISCLFHTKNYSANSWDKM